MASLSMTHTRAAGQAASFNFLLNSSGQATPVTVSASVVPRVTSSHASSSSSQPSRSSPPSTPFVPNSSSPRAPLAPSLKATVTDCPPTDTKSTSITRQGDRANGSPTDNSSSSANLQTDPLPALSLATAAPILKYSPEGKLVVGVGTMSEADWAAAFGINSGHLIPVTGPRSAQLLLPSPASISRPALPPTVSSSQEPASRFAAIGGQAELNGSMVAPPQNQDLDRDGAAAVMEEDVWLQIRAEARAAAEEEPALASYLYSTVLTHRSLEPALAAHIANKLSSPTLLASHLFELFREIFLDDRSIQAAIRADLMAVRQKDPACDGFLLCFLNYKGFAALQAYRAAHRLWQQGRYSMAMALQNRMSEVFQVDIHPAAQIGKGVMLDHATGVVIGETAVVGDEVSMLHNVSLGGTGAIAGIRHPRVGRGSVIGAGARILGPVTLGERVKVGAGSLVLTDVEAEATVVGNPAKIAKAIDAPRKTEVIRLKANQWVYDVCVERRCTVADIRALNPTVDIDRVLAGQRLVVPRRPSPFDPIERELTRAAQQLSTTFAAGPTGGAARTQATTAPASADSSPAPSAKKPAGTTAPPAPTAPPPGPSPSLPSAAGPSPSAAPTKPAARPSSGSWLDSLLGGPAGGGRPDEVEEYVLKRKEWVCDVASRLDVDIEYLRRLNPGVNLDNVRPKQRINVPKSRAARLRQQPSAARGADVAGAGSKRGKEEEEKKGKEGGGVAIGDAAPVCAPPPICKPPASAGREGASAGSQAGGDVCAVQEAKGAGAAREAKGGPAQGVAAAGAVVGGAGGSRGAPAAEASFFDAIIRGMSGDGKQKDSAGGTLEKPQQKVAEAAAPVKQQKHQQQAPPQQQQAQGQQGANQRWRVHRVRRGEWISSLAADYGLTVEQLQDMNPGVDLAKVKPADEIRLPAGRRRATGAALPLEAADVEAMGGALVVAAGGADKGGGGGAAGAGGSAGPQGSAAGAAGAHLAGARVGMVMPGDSLADIAERYGVAWQELAERNGVREGEEGGGLQVGQILIIPEKKPHQVASIGGVGHWLGWQSAGGRGAAAAGGGAILAQAPAGVSVSLSIALVVASSLAAAAIMRLNAPLLSASGAGGLVSSLQALPSRLPEPIASAWAQVTRGRGADGAAAGASLSSLRDSATTPTWVVPPGWSAPTHADMRTILALSSLSPSSPSLGGLLASQGVATSAALLPAIDAACRAAADSFLASGPVLAAVALLRAPRADPSLLRLLPFRQRPKTVKVGALGAQGVGGADGRGLARVALAAVPQLVVGSEAIGACVWAEGGGAAGGAVDGVAVRGAEGAGEGGEEQYSVGVLLMSLPPGMRMASAVIGEGEGQGEDQGEGKGSGGGGTEAVASALAVAVGRLTQAMEQSLPSPPSLHPTSPLTSGPTSAVPSPLLAARLAALWGCILGSRHSTIPGTRHVPVPHRISAQPLAAPALARVSAPLSARLHSRRSSSSGSGSSRGVGQGVTVVGIAEGVDLNGAFVASVLGQWLYGPNVTLLSVPPAKKRREPISS
ncbi:unnamed protein product [Closterium sp. Yama58-4]|nr:unnamed protein product [Closterium sp. Yama58-4]